LESPKLDENLNLTNKNDSN